MSVNGRRAYTVKEVAELSKVSARTLRFYDEIGLLEPAYVGENGYRYYEKEQLLKLRQILFYRELGFELGHIQGIVNDPGFDKVEALKAHRLRLAKEAERTRDLIGTIDKTLAHLEKEAPMKDDDMYKGFDPKKQAEYERYLIERGGEASREHIEESKRRTKGWKKEDFERVQQDYDELHRAFVDAINRGLAADSDAVQSIVNRHYQVVSRFWTPDAQSYAGLGNLYTEHGDFRKLYDGYHPDLAEYLAKAMKAYASQKLK